MSDADLIAELVAACEASFIEHYSERSGLNSCPCSCTVSPADDSLCDCGAVEHNSRLKDVIEKAKAARR